MGLTEAGQKKTEEHARRVRDMFANIAPRYDLLNHVLSANIDKRWRRRVVKKLTGLLPEDARVLDVGCGTGDLRIELFENTAAHVTGVDFCGPMLKLAKTNAPQRQFIEGDALNLPFAEASFDGLTTGFALKLRRCRARLTRTAQSSETGRPCSDTGVFASSESALRIFRSVL
jgi:demethylmenaquinone methyltransferase/2-methoxy-6-polyprenyl-1,4-benzoquinol methylase